MVGFFFLVWVVFGLLGRGGFWDYCEGLIVVLGVREYEFVLDFFNMIVSFCFFYFRI